MRLPRYSVFVLPLLLATASGCADKSRPAGADAEASADQPIVSSAEVVVDFPVSCDPAVQDDFNTAVAAVHNMTYNVARGQFKAILEKDPDCGMAHWGVGMTYIHPLWSDSPSEEHMVDGVERVAAARALELSERESAYVDALAMYYENADLELYERLKKFAEGVDQVHHAYPDDIEAKAFHAVTHLSTMAPGTVDMEIIDHAAEAAYEVLEQQPDHPGGLHYVIHAYDYPDLAERAVDVAHHYGRLAPDNPHSLHMPSHIFTRLGMWDESIELNTRAASVAKSQPYGDAVSAHYPHALDYLLYAYLQSGRTEMASQIVDSLKAIQMPVQAHPASAYHIAAAEARWTLERQDWEGAASVMPRVPADFPWDDFPQFEALAWFGVAMGSARSQDNPRATRAIMRLIDLEEKTTHPYWKNQVKVMRLASQAWLHESIGDENRSEEVMTEAAELESTMEKHAITPGEILPASELLGDLLLKHGKPAEALSAFEVALERSQNRFNSLYGAGRAAEQAGQDDKAQTYYRQLIEVCDKADTDHPGLEHARSFVST
jgi:tetratricopeptide (TPR) repeat protein